MFSSRSGRSRAPNRIAELLATFAASGRQPCDLTGSNPTRAGIRYPDELLRVLVDAQADSLAYQPEPFGLLRARAAVSAHASRLGHAADSDDILLTASTSEAYSFLFKLLCDAGDSVLVPAPSYPLFEHLAELEGVHAVPYRLAYDGAWHVDLDSVRRALGPRTRAIIVVSPNNPTGQYLKPNELEALAQLGVAIISDEVFFEYPLTVVQPPALRARECLTFALGGLSKLAGLPQLKLAWTIISGPEAARREARERLELIADTFLSVATPVQIALPGILAACPALTTALGDRCRDNLASLQQAVRSSALTALRPEAGWSAVVRLPFVKSEEEWVLGLLSEQLLLVQPGWFYDFESEPFAVVSLLGEPAVFREGVGRLVEYVARVAS